MTLTVFVLGALLFAVSPAFAQGGIQTPFGAANNRNVVVTDFGPRQGIDHEFTTPLGSLTYAVQQFKPIDLSGGSGTGNSHHSGDSGSGSSPRCYSCTMRGDWGDSLTTRRYPLGTSLWVGSTIQHAGPTNGFSAPSVLANNTTNRWMSLALVFGFGFTF